MTIEGCVSPARLLWGGATPGLYSAINRHRAKCRQYRVGPTGRPRRCSRDQARRTMFRVRSCDSWLNPDPAPRSERSCVSPVTSSGWSQQQYARIPR
jgi:hypothetical protein